MTVRSEELTERVPVNWLDLAALDRMIGAIPAQKEGRWLARCVGVLVPDSNYPAGAEGTRRTVGLADALPIALNPARVTPRTPWPSPSVADSGGSSRMADDYAQPAYDEA